MHFMSVYGETLCRQQHTGLGIRARVWSTVVHACACCADCFVCSKHRWAIHTSGNPIGAAGVQVDRRLFLVAVGQAGNETFQRVEWEQGLRRGGSHDAECCQLGASAASLCVLRCVVCCSRLQVVLQCFEQQLLHMLDFAGKTGSASLAHCVFAF